MDELHRGSFCDYCGQHANTYTRVLKTLPGGEYQEVRACANCEAHYEPLRFLRIRLDKFPYILDKRPPFWTNTTTLHGLFNGKQATLQGRLPLDTFPLIEDFEVILEGFTRKHLFEKEPLTYQAKFFSSSHGYLAHFCHKNTLQDLCREDFVIPCGNFDAPFIDFEPGWSLLIAENESFVYILTFKEVNKTEGIIIYFPAFEDYEHNVWFKVEKSRYYSQWERALQLCHSWQRKTL